MPIQSHNPLDHMEPEENYSSSSNMPEGHYVVIGRFLVACASVESTAHNILRPMIELDEPIARAVIGQPRLDDLLNVIGNLCIHFGHTEVEVKALREIKTQISYIYRVRNIIAHQEPAWREGWLRYDRWASAKDIRDRPNLLYVVRLVELENLTSLAREVGNPLYDATYRWMQKKAFDASSLHRLESLLRTLELPADPAKPYPHAGQPL